MTRKAFAALLAKHNVTWRIEDGAIEVDAPDGFVFKDTGLHWLQHWMEGWIRADSYAHIASDLAGGVERCQITDCDICEENEA